MPIKYVPNDAAHAKHADADRGIRVLRKQAGNDARKHIAAAALCHARVAGAVDITLALRGNHLRKCPLHYNPQPVLLSLRDGEPPAFETVGGRPKQAHKFAGMRRNDGFCPLGPQVKQMQLARQVKQGGGIQ